MDDKALALLGNMMANTSKEVSHFEGPDIEEFKELSPHAGIDEIKQVDVAITNNLLKVLHATFPSASTIKSACALINTTMKVLAERRKILTIDYDNKRNVSERSPLFPLT